MLEEGGGEAGAAGRVVFTADRAHLARLLPEHFGHDHKAKVLQLLCTPLRVPGFVFKVQLLSQSGLQVLQDKHHENSS